MLKAIVTITAFPGWDFDPFIYPPTPGGIGPTGAMFCDGVVAIGALMLLLANRLSGVPGRLAPLALFSLGSIGVLAHVWPLADHPIADMWIGSSWFAAMLLGLAFASLPSDLRGMRLRAIAAAAFVGFVALIAVRGGQQVLLEHPQTVADFHRNRESIFAAQGWSLDSPMAKAYERRILQAEATGWFGLANVYATFAAAGAVISLMLAAAWIRSFRRGDAEGHSRATDLATLFAAAASVGALYFAASKGGYIAAALGLVGAIALGLVMSPRLRGRVGERASLWTGVCAMAALGGSFALVIGRGFLGDGVGQLSLLFRWFYMQAAARIGLTHLPQGVGPDGFQQAYMLAKNPLSPEDVTSSHNLLLDWFACLGVFGLAWAALWVMWVWRAGAAVASPVMPAGAPTEETSESDRRDRWTLAAIGAFASVVAVRIDQEAMTLDAAVARLVGLIAFCIVSWVMYSSFRRDARLMRLALGAGVIAAGAHALIDVTGVWPSAAAWLAVLIGAAAVAPTPRAAAAAPRDKRIAEAGIVAIVALTVTTIFPVGRVFMWEDWLRSSAHRAGVAAIQQQRWQEILESVRTRRPGAAEEARAFAAELKVETEPAAIDRALQQNELAIMDSVLLTFEKLRHLEREWKIRREASRIYLRKAALLRAMGEEARAAEAEHAAEAVMTEVPAHTRTSSELAWLAIVRESIARGDGEREMVLKAMEALEAAHKLSPYELEYVVRLMRLAERAKDPELAKRWAARAIELNEGQKYDLEVKGMKSRDLEDARRLLNGS